ncbi:PAS domain S-box protein [Geoalkalibacter sp.]|uniref:PAS domain S-box protein n=1 Tax=Geoalkalibacter sp. TaxID=3041440 RepID=UPI00272E2513|nr:PAS domain S-box protein [Geoalkalibacter sp.]
MPKRPHNARKSLAGPWLAAAFFLVLLAGSLLSWWSIQRSDEALRQELLRQAEWLAQTLNVDQLKILTEPRPDSFSPTLYRLRQQLEAVLSADSRQRRVILLERGAEGARLILEVAGPESPGWPESNAVDPLFTGETSTVLGPWRDAKGRFLRAAVPLARFDGERTVFLCLDVDAEDWLHKRYGAALPALCGTLVLSLILGASGWMRRGEARAAGRSRSSLRSFAPWLVAAVGVVVTLVAAWTAHEQERRDRREGFAQLAAARTKSVAEILHDVRDYELESLARFYEGSEHVTQEEFLHFTGFLVKNPVVKAWALIPAVAAEQVRVFEEQARAEGLDGFSVRQMDGEGRPVPASGRETVFPVLYVAPLESNRDVLGYDLGSEALRRVALVEAAHTGLVTASDPIALADIPDDQGLLIYRPVFMENEPSRLRGFALAVLHLDKLLVARDADDSLHLELSLIKPGQPSWRLLAWDGEETHALSGFSLHRPVFAYGKTFVVSAHAGPDFFKARPAGAGLFALATGAVLTAALVGLTWTVLRRREELERLVAARTQSLGKSEAFSRMLLATIPIPVFYKDKDGRYLGFNQAFEDFFGKSSADLIGKSVFDISPPDLARIYHAQDCVLFEKPGVQVYESQVRDARDQLHEVVFHKASMLDEKGAVIGLIGAILDITERKQSENALRESEARLRAIKDSAQDAIIMMDGQGAISFWNPAAEKILGYRAEEALGRPLHELLAPPRHLDLYRKAFPDFQRAGQGRALGRTLDLTARRKDQQDIDIALSLSAVFLGGQWHAVGILRDVTEQKRTQEEILQTNRELEAAIARANELAARAEAANIAKSEFLANMSHEIRTPMNGVIGTMELLLESPLNEEQRQYVQMAQASGRALLSLIDDILDVSKIEAGKFDLEIKEFDLEALLRDCSATLGVQAREKGLALVCELDSAVPRELRGDPDRLRQILLNLAGNAVKFTPAGRVDIRVALTRDTEAEVLLRFSVCDTGIGIAPDKIGLLFNKFTQVDASITRRYGGTGLGLAISRQLVELMGGQIGVESQPGRGSEFWFTARFGRACRPADTYAPLESVAFGAYRAPSSSLPEVRPRVLVVEDNRTNQRVALGLLEKLGVTVELATNGIEALKLLQTLPCDLVLMDVQMPEMDGFEATRAIRDPRARVLNPQVPIVAMTAHAMQGDRERCLAAGMNDYLSKPLSARALDAVLKRWLPWTVEKPAAHLI